MAMRMPRLFKPAGHGGSAGGEWVSNGPRPLTEPAPMLQWPKSAPSAESERCAPLTTSRAHIRTKRFPGHTGVNEEQFTAIIESPSTSPIDLLKALTQVMETSREMTHESQVGEPFIMDIRLVAG